MNKCCLFTWHAPPHQVQHGFFSFPPCGVIDASAFSWLAAGVRTCASVWRGSAVRGLMWRSIGEGNKDGPDSGGGVFYFHGHPSAPLSCRSDAHGAARPPLQFTVFKKLPHLPLSGALARPCEDCTDNDCSCSHRA